MRPVKPLAFPFAASSGTPSVTVDEDGAFVVAWTNRTNSTFNFARYQSGRWFQPRTIVSGDLAINKADLPMIDSDRAGALSASWMMREGHGTSIRIARSKNAGATWDRPQSPHPKMASQFGFVSLKGGADGTLHAAWLDGRKLEGGEEGKGDMELRYAAVDEKGHLSDSVLLDARVCDCCQTSMALTADGPIVAYRDRGDDETRDISVVRKTAGGWTQPKTLSSDGWKIAGCPVNGPRVDARDREVVIAWFTAGGGSNRMLISFSHDAGATFETPVAIHDGTPAGQTDVALLEDGSAIVSWVETTPEESTVVARRVTSAGDHGPILRLGEAPSPSVIGVPRLGVSGQTALVAWNGAKSVEMATIEIPKE